MDVTLSKATEPRMLPLYAFWDYLTKPKSFVKDDERRRVRLISVLLFVFALFVTVYLITDGSLRYSTSIILICLLWGAYALSRTKRYNIAAYLAVGATNAIALYVVASSVGEIPAFVMLSVVLLANLLLPFQGAVLIAALNNLFVVLLPILDPRFYDAMTPPFVIACSILLIVFNIHRNGQERDRQAQLKESLGRSEEANKTLLKANALAKEAVRLKSEFMSTMSHELRTPLNAITGFCGIMLEGMGGKIDDEARHMLERVQSNSERLLLLINEVLDIAKIEADRIELASEPLSTRDLAKRWKAQVHVLAENKGLSFDTMIDPTLPETFYGDPERITQIATNLLSNAFKFTESGGVELRLKSGQSTWQIEVHDTGIGIPPHALNYIFDEFRQLDGSSTRVFGGSGLGLAIVRKLCLLMGGNVRVSSTLGEGSTFTVTLPLIKQPEALEPALADALQTEQ